jgi:hypothetical protein
MIAEIALVKLFISWEDFLEETFVRYLAGASSMGGRKPPRLVAVSGTDAARRILYSNTSRGYLNWTNAGEIVKRAEAYFRDGEPYSTPIRSITSEIDEMTVIRNRIVHESDVARKKFSSLIRSKLGHGGRGMTPGRFLLTLNKNLSPPTSFLDNYGAVLDVAAGMIVR